MGWRPEVLFAACKRVGMLSPAIHLPGSGTPAPFDCNFSRPEVLLLGDQQQSTEYAIEYQTADVPAIRKGDPVQVTVGGVATTYTARAHATTVGDGTYSKVELQL